MRYEVLVEQLEERKKMDVSKEKALKEKEQEYLILEKEKHVLKEQLEKENLFLKEKLDFTERKLKSAQVLANHYKKQNAVKEMHQLKKTDGVLSNNIDPMKYLCTSIEKLLGTVLPGKHAHEKASLLITTLSSSKLLKGEGLKVLNELNRQHISLVLKEWKLLKAFDCSSVGTFKTSMLQAKHAIRDEDKKGYFPSVSSVTRCHQLLDNHGKNLVGYERKETRYGEVYYINFDKVIRLLLKATGLYEKAQKASVTIAFTADGATLMKSHTHVSRGVKITDVDGYHPLTRMPLTTINEEEDGDGTHFNMVQSRELCIILVMADVKDSKQLYNDVFKEFYDYSKQLHQFGMEEKEGEPALQPFLVTRPQDRKSAQTVSNKGGNCKMKTCFCHLCSCRKDELVAFKFGNSCCNRCITKHQARCYHHAVCDLCSTKVLLSVLDGELAKYIERCSTSYHDIKKIEVT
jgi:hypothetical protein